MDAGLPDCLLLCIKTELPDSICQPANSTCICINEDLNTAIRSCVAANCTVIDALEARKYHNLYCGEPIRRNIIQIPIVWSMFSITLIAVMARLLARTPLVSRTYTVSWDDGCILASLAALVVADICTHLSVELGFGQDIWMLSPEQITRILFVFFVDEIVYAIIISVTKISIILFYLRIFPEPWFRRACRLFLYITGVFGVWHIFQILFVCWPIDYNWTYWDGKHSGKRGDVRLFSFINAGLNIVLDLSICFLPVTQFVATSWTVKTKISTSLIFLIGLLVTVASCIRLETLTQFGDTNNPTYDLKGLALWSLIELHLSVIYACIPGSLSFWRRAPRYFRGNGPTQAQGRHNPRTRASLSRALSRITSPVAITDQRDHPGPQRTDVEMHERDFRS